MRRGESIFELDPNAQEEVEKGFELEGSNLSGVSARCSWNEQDPARLSFRQGQQQNVENVNIPSDSEDTDRVLLNNTDLSYINSEKFTNINDYKEGELREKTNIFESTELLHVKKLEGIHLVFNLEAGSLLPLAIR